MGRAMEGLLVIHYIDGNIIGSPTIESHVWLVCEVLSSLTQYDFRVKGVKILLALEHVVFLGYRIKQGEYDLSPYFTKLRENLPTIQG